MSTRRDRNVFRNAFTLLALLALLVLGTAPLAAQEPRIADLTIEGSAVPLRLVGYGLVTGLDGTGDRSMSTRQGGMTVQAVVNLLKRFDLSVPPEMLRTANVAAVLVTAEVSPYLRPGGRFITHVSALGDARSLRGGVLWVTPLVAGPNGPAFASAQGSLVIDDGSAADGGVTNVRWRSRSSAPVNHATIPDGGVLEADLPRPTVPLATKLWLKEPDLATAQRIASAINAALGDGKAKVEDPGAIALELTGTTDEKAEAIGKVRDLRIRTAQRNAVFLDARSGLVVAGGDAAVGAAVVRQGRVMLSIIGPSTNPASGTAAAPRDTSVRAIDNGISLRLPVGTSVLEVTAALRAVDAQPSDVAAILLALRQVGALPVEVVVR